MTYIQYVNERIKAEVAKADRIVLFGQNVSGGSCISGLTRGLPSDERHIVINTPNIENAQVGIGFGLMMNGVDSCFFMKQQDFLLLGIDQLVNTYNFVRMKEPAASFTIVNVTVDQGYQGIQSSLNNFGDFCSIARIPGFTVTNRHDVEYVFGTHLVSPGFRIISVSQRLFGTDVLECDTGVTAHNQGEIFQYFEGEDATIACFNFSFPQGLKLHQELKEKGLSTSLFSVSAVTPCDWSCILNDVWRTRKLVVLDDSKSENRSCYHLSSTVYQTCDVDSVLLLVRDSTDELLRPHPEDFTVDCDAVAKALTAAAGSIKHLTADGHTVEVL